ncbi:MAG: hypothetical protein GZ085_02120 [Sulfuriferula multivorans]|uniref:Uncharacterized protein n=1 Tax=Sulfuriferula multivorans TaxID=1559896 RepID=A0A7C9P2I8_9PROT|nr:hypothetical protein [Sulfuriferula multivorans]
MHEAYDNQQSGLCLISGMGMVAVWPGQAGRGEALKNGTIKFDFLEGTSKNSEFAQMQGAEKISPRRICVICKQEFFSATQQLG